MENPVSGPEGNEEGIEKKVRTLLHEIKNPLSTIYLSIDSLRNAQEDGEDPEEYIQLLEKSARKIDTVINEWLQAQ